MYFTISCQGEMMIAGMQFIIDQCSWSPDDAIAYFHRYFRWYNTEHLHSAIDYVTPEQCHNGLRDSIVAERKAKLEKQRYLRRQVNRHGRDCSFSWLARSPHYQPGAL